MHIAWLYLLHAELQKSKVDYRNRLPNGRLERIDGEPRTWSLRECLEYKWPTATAVSKNIEVTVGLRNKVEHRYHAAVAQFAAGYAQALLLNFEEELTTFFGNDYSLGLQLRFPIFIGSITPLGQRKLIELRNELPRDARDFIASFEAGLDPVIARDQHYEFRVVLTPKLGAKTDADASLTFVREDDLSEAEKAALATLGRSGQVVVREQVRPVANAGLVKPREAAQLIEQRVAYAVRTHHVVAAWKKLRCRPPAGDPHPERTDERYCVYDQPHKDYLFTSAFIAKVAREMQTEAKFKAFTGFDAVLKPMQPVELGS